MAVLTAYQEQWLEHDGKEVWLNGYRHTLEVKTRHAIYPYNRTELYVFAAPVNKETKYYQESKARLGDDWVLDVLNGSEDLTVAVMYQLGWKVAE